MHWKYTSKKRGKSGKWVYTYTNKAGNTHQYTPLQALTGKKSVDEYRDFDNRKDTMESQMYEVLGEKLHARKREEHWNDEANRSSQINAKYSKESHAKSEYYRIKQKHLSSAQAFLESNYKGVVNQTCESYAKSQKTIYHKLQKSKKPYAKKLLGIIDG